MMDTAKQGVTLPPESNPSMLLYALVSGIVAWELPLSLTAFTNVAIGVVISYYGFSPGSLRRNVLTTSVKVPFSARLVGKKTASQL